MFVSSVLPTACVPYLDLFGYVSPNCKPIAVKTKFSLSDQKVIKAETDRLLRQNQLFRQFNFCVPYPDLFGNVSPNCKPIAVKTRKFSLSDQKIIKAETDRLLRENRIETSKSPRRAQPLVVEDGKGKLRMCIDYSQTINLFTTLDAHPLPSIDSIVNEVAKWKFISTL